MDGALAHAVFDMKLPNIRKEVDDFFAAAEVARQQAGITQIVALRRKLENGKAECIIIPASLVRSGETELKEQGYTMSASSDVTGLNKGLKSFDFEQTITFDMTNKNKKK